MNTQVIVHHVATTVQRRIDEVSSYLFDPRTMPQWSAVLYAVEEPGVVSLSQRGRRLRANMQLLGVSLTVEGELLALDLEACRGTVRIAPVDGDGMVAPGRSARLPTSSPRLGRSVTWERTPERRRAFSAWHQNSNSSNAIAAS